MPTWSWTEAPWGASLAGGEPALEEEPRINVPVGTAALILLPKRGERDREGGANVTVAAGHSRSKKRTFLSKSVVVKRIELEAEHWE